ncbi:PLLP [Cervus elaphus hippelaphus]|uniref:Plasmolipin n=1 Tax=Cervus elaphus hippelaphus TaxID=46360 RepID=A0A212DE14_CEREH|nr:PLLP [Cervus elaphus hippelaphus]
MRNVSCRGRPMVKARKPPLCGLQPECWGLWETLAPSHPLQVLGLLVWALIADTPYHLYPSYGWVMFVAVFLWLVTIVFFVLYLFQLHMKLYMVPWPLVLMVFNVGATVLYITAFITCSASVEPTSLKGSRPYNQRAAASFFSCLVMIAYGVSTFLSFQAWRGVGSNAATSQMAGGYA